MLFFPFSSFEVKKIESEDEYVNIYLNYLGRYKSIIEEKMPKNIIFKDIPINQFGRDISEYGVIKFKFSKFWEVEKEILLEENPNCFISF